MLHGFSDLRCFLIGEHLGHSYSPQIHAGFGDYPYRNIELPPEGVGPFLEAREFDALNVTIPYKKTVIPYLARLSDKARSIGAVNTIRKMPDGSLWGYNTDYEGFSRLLELGNFDPRGKKVLVLGSGGASATACAVMRDRGAASVTVISRSGPDNYENLERHVDADLIVNTTPVGMFPHNGIAPLDLKRFPHLSGVIDMIYNPLRTRLLMDAEALGIPAIGGLPMLVAQGRAAAEIFTGETIPQKDERAVCDSLLDSMLNVVLIGMPGCGKSSIGRALASELGFDFADSDAWLREHGVDPATFIRERGEAAFREEETRALEDLGKRSRAVIATGGGVVTVQSNLDLLRQNGTIVFLTRPLDKLAKGGRPLTLSKGVDLLWREREPLYRAFADVTVGNDGTPGEALGHILAALKRM